MARALSRGVVSKAVPLCSVRVNVAPDGKDGHRTWHAEPAVEGRPFKVKCGGELRTGWRTARKLILAKAFRGAIQTACRILGTGNEEPL